MKHTVFSMYKRRIAIGFIKNKIFYMTVHPGRVSIFTTNYMLGRKFDIIFMIVTLETDTCSLTSKSMSADSQLDKSTALFIWSEFASEKCQAAQS